MAYNFAKHNHGNQFNIKTEGFEYKKLEELYKQDPDKTYVIRAIYINKKGRYGDAPVFATDSFFLNIPSHVLTDAQEILADPEAIADINAAHMGCKIYSYDKDGRTLYSVEFVNL